MSQTRVRGKAVAGITDHLPPWLRSVAGDEATRGQWTAPALIMDEGISKLMKLPCGENSGSEDYLRISSEKKEFTHSSEIKITLTKFADKNVSLLLRALLNLWSYGERERRICGNAGPGNENFYNFVKISTTERGAGDPWDRGAGAES